MSFEHSLGALISSLLPGRAAREVPRIIRPDYILCGSMLFVVFGCLALNPPPRAPQLPSAFDFQRKNHASVSAEAPAATVPPVWVDTRSGVYHFPDSGAYGQTPRGRFLEVKAAKALGYRSSAKM